MSGTGCGGTPLAASAKYWEREGGREFHLAATANPYER
jgi:hypothetical protein